MPRKTSSRAAAAASATPRFNEAAARCRGKQPDPAFGRAEHRASMRPRPDAAENVAGAVLRDEHGGASMRPRPDAAENYRVNALCAAAGVASMRPRPDAAENSMRRASVQGRHERFNEAAARCRGKRHPRTW